MSKHSKYKNTGILYELLVRQIATETLNNSGTPKAMGIVKSHFNKRTQIGKELVLYQNLIRERFNTETKAKTFVTAAIKARSKIKIKELRKEKYKLVKEVFSNYNTSNFFKSRIPNYRVLAAIHCIFENTSKTPADFVRNQYTLIEHITRKKNRVYEVYEKQDKDLRLLSYRILVDKFNSKYNGLNRKQKGLLKEYINNISDTNKLREYLNKEIVRVHKALKREIPKVDDKVTKIKLVEVTNQIARLSKGSTVKDKQVLGMMRYYQLLKEVKETCECENC
jgi:hypothetical protein